jgi:hypothetical protein
MQMSALPNNSKLLQDMLMSQLTEHGKFSELLSINVPCPVDPDIILVSVIPDVRCTLSRMPLSLSSFLWGATMYLLPCADLC